MPRKTAKDREAEFEKWESTPVYLTPEGLKELQDKFEYLKKKLPEIIKEVARTAAYGDRSDNAEYRAAKSRLRGTQKHLAIMEDQLRKIKIIPSGPSASGKVQMGSKVTIESKDGKKMELRIVGPKETDPPRSFISHESPLGAALIGHAAGDAVKFEAGNAEQEYKILKVE